MSASDKDASEAAKAALERAVSAHAGGDLAAAEAGYREAAIAGDREAAFQLGLILRDRGDVDGAAEAYRHAANAGHPEAVLNLATLYGYELGRPEEARALYEAAIKRGDPRAMFELGYLLWREEDWGGARDAFARAAHAGHPRGHLELGFLLADGEREETKEEALEAFERAAAAGVEEAWTQVGWQLARLGEVESAEAPLRRACATGELVSADILYDVLKALGHADEAESVLAEASERAKREVSLDYRELLGEYLGEDLREDDVRRWMHEEVDEGKPIELVTLVFDAARLAEAETRLRLAIEYGDVEAVAKLADLYEKTGRRAAAEEVRRG